MGFKFFNFKGSLIKKRKTVREPGGVVCIGYRRNDEYHDSGPSSSRRPNGITNNNLETTTQSHPPPLVATEQVTSQIPLNWCGTKVPEHDETKPPTNGVRGVVKIKQTAPKPAAQEIFHTQPETPIVNQSKTIAPKAPIKEPEPPIKEPESSIKEPEAPIKEPEPPIITPPPSNARQIETSQPPESLEEHITSDDYITMRAKSETNSEARAQDRTSTLIAMTEKDDYDDDDEDYDDDDDFGYDPHGHGDYEDIEVPEHTEVPAPTRTSPEPESLFARVGKPTQPEPQKKKTSFDDNEGYSSQAASIFFSGEEPEPEIRIRNHALARNDGDNGSQTSC